VADFELKVTGLREVQRSLYSYSQQLGDKVVIQALLEGARFMQKRARANAPKRTGRLRRGIVVRKSKINNGKRRELLGVYMTLRKGRGRADKNDAFYGRFVEDGYNVRGKSRTGKGQRKEIVERFGRRTGRKSLPGSRDIPPQRYMKRAFDSTKEASARLIVAATERGALILKRKLGLR
jgi:HK97 gp10 family phage protein